MLIDAFARRIGSPLDALLTLHDADGNADRRPTTTPPAPTRGSAATCRRASTCSRIRDLGFTGGPAHAYRVSLAADARRRRRPAAGLRAEVPARRAARQPRRAREAVVRRRPDELPRRRDGRRRRPAAGRDRRRRRPCFPPAPAASSCSPPPPTRRSARSRSRSRRPRLLDGELVTRTGQPEAAGPGRAAGVPHGARRRAVHRRSRWRRCPPSACSSSPARSPALTAKVLAPSAELDARQAEWEKKVAADPDVGRARRRRRSASEGRGQPRRSSPTARSSPPAGNAATEIYTDRRAHGPQGHRRRPARMPRRTRRSPQQRPRPRGERQLRPEPVRRRPSRPKANPPAGNARRVRQGAGDVQPGELRRRRRDRRQRRRPAGRSPRRWARPQTAIFLTKDAGRRRHAQRADVHARPDVRRRTT